MLHLFYYIPRVITKYFLKFNKKTIVKLCLDEHISSSWHFFVLLKFLVVIVFCDLKSSINARAPPRVDLFKNSILGGFLYEKFREFKAFKRITQ